jgi:hypothetical protein
LRATALSPRARQAGAGATGATTAPSPPLPWVEGKTTFEIPAARATHWFLLTADG